MLMESGEICRMYREAKKPRAQIAILADLNLCTRREIISVLRAAGEKVEMPKKIKKINTPKKEERDMAETKEEHIQFVHTIKEPPKTVEGGNIPDAVVTAMFLRLDELEAEIKAREKEWKEIVAYMGITPHGGIF